ncbi:MAG TPA: VCBS repeat-containing protein [Pyrinomonadaceae bacterium]|nr:VCBS repeat-containing protein [Pyrinomonadaceae bacterium]
MRYRLSPTAVSSRSISVILFAISLAVFNIETFAQGGQIVSNGPEIGRNVKYDVSPPLRTMKTDVSQKVKKEEDDKGADGPVGRFDHSGDGALQSSHGVGAFSSPDLIPGTTVNFAGMGGLGGTPPDPVGDIGPNHYVQMVNARFQIFTRAGVSVFGPSNINTLFAGFGGPCQTENAGDPIVVYDQFADRWILSQFSDSVGPFFNCVAISTTGDPTGTYYRYAFETPTFPDYPKYGIWRDSYLINTRENGQNLMGNIALDRAAMIAGNPVVRTVRHTVAQGAAGPNGLLPADIDGFGLPPAGAPAYFVGTSDNDIGAAADAVQLYRLAVDWTPATPTSTFTGPFTMPTASFDTVFPCTPSSRECIPQPGTTVKIDILSYRQRPTFRLAYRNFGTYESLVTLQSVEAATGIAGMRWWEIRDPAGTPFIHQQGTYGPGATDGIHRWMGSIAMDRLGNMGMGYSVSNATDTFPGIRYTGRLVTDPLGTMPQGEGVIVNGGGSQTSSAFRWGDYTSMNIDPLDDCTFWYTNEYYATTSTTAYASRIASFKFPNCTATRRPVTDFDGDGKTDISIFRPGPGQWWYLKSSDNSNAAATFGTSTDTLVPADYTGDGKTDLAFYRPSDGNWFVLRSENSTFYAFPFGVNTDQPMPADYDADGKTDAAVFRASTSTWYVNLSTGGTSIVNFGIPGDLPVSSDYDGDGRADIAIFRPSAGTWWINRSSGSTVVYQFGTSTDKRVPGDYTGDGKSDVALYRPSTGEWIVLRSEDLSYYAAPFGNSTDVPSPGDYDGDGKFDNAVFRPSDSTWYINRSTAGVLIRPFGIAGDISVPSVYVR